MSTITFDDFMKVDLRIARIEKAEPVPGADKLLALSLDVGDSRRQVFAGIKAAYEPDSLVGRHVIVVANLAPRKMRFGVSEGMVLAAGFGAVALMMLPRLATGVGGLEWPDVKPLIERQLGDHVGVRADREPV